MLNGGNFKYNNYYNFKSNYFNKYGINNQRISNKSYYKHSKLYEQVKTYSLGTSKIYTEYHK